MAATFQLQVPDCYIYLYHTDEYLILPQYPEHLSDTMASTFREQNALGRTAPVWSYSNSGPRTMQIQLKLQRDIMNDLNLKGSNIRIRYNSTDDFGESSIITSPGDDYVDVLIKKLQSIALPRFNANSKEIIPPRVAVRFGNELFVKGIVNGQVGVGYALPLMRTKEGFYKYSDITVDFNVTETQPYDADTIGSLGSFRGLTAGLKEKIGG